MLILTVALGSCSGGGGGDDDGGFSQADYQLLYSLNAVQLSGHTIRWASLPIRVTSSVGGTPADYNRWNTATNGAVSFTFGAGGSVTVSWSSSTVWCGVTSINWSSSGTFTSARVQIARDQTGCSGGASNTNTHEAGHVIGFLGHTSSGMMAPTGGPNITDAESRFVRLLYSMAPGSDISGHLRIREGSGQNQYDASGRRRYSMTIY
jgi:hypothetical protein